MKVNKLGRDTFTGKRVVVQFGKFLDIEGRQVIRLCGCGCWE